MLLERVVDLLAPALRAAAAPSLVDATLGLGGHAEARARRGARARARRRARPRPEALAAGRRAAGSLRRPGRLVDRRARGRTTCSPARCSAELGGRACVDGVLFDLGVSSLQLDRRERGFAYAARRAARHADGPDAPGTHRGRGPQHLRRRPSSPGSCGSTARSASPGGSPTRSCASAGGEPFTTSGRLVELIRDAMPAADPPHRRQPGQAHLPGAADRGQRRAGGAARGRCPAAIDALAVGGRVVVLAYHSLEDRHREARRSPPAPPRDVPDDFPSCPRATSPRCGCSPAVPSRPRDDEIAANPRAALGPAASGRADPGGGVSTPSSGRVPAAARRACASDAAVRAPRRDGVAARRGARPRDRAPRRAVRGAALARAACGGLVGLLVLNTAMQRSAFTAATPSSQQAAALDVPPRRRSTWRSTGCRARRCSAERATELGMVPMTTPGLPAAVRRRGPRRPEAAVAGTGPQLAAPPTMPAERRAGPWRRPGRRTAGAGHRPQTGPAAGRRPAPGQAQTRASRTRAGQQRSRSTAQRQAAASQPGAAARPAALSSGRATGQPAAPPAAAAPSRERRARRLHTRVAHRLPAVAFVLSMFAARLVQLQGVDAAATPPMAAARVDRARVTLHATARRDPRPQRRRAADQRRRR